MKLKTRASLYNTNIVCCSQRDDSDSSFAVKALKAVLALSVISACFFMSELNAQSFTAGNIAVLQFSSSGSNVTGSVIELNTTSSGQSAVTTRNIYANPPTTSGDTIRFSSSAATTCYLANSNDGTLLLFDGALTTNSSANTNTITKRAVGTYNNAGTYTRQTTYTGTSGNQPRSATTLNNSTMYIGDQGGIYSNGTSAASPSANIRSVKAFGDTVYFFIASASSAPVGKIYSATGGTLTYLPGLANGTTNCQDFYLISSGSNGATFDVLYVLSASSATAGTINKYSLVSGSWTANSSYTTSFGGFGLAAQKSGSGANLFVSTGTGATTANSVIKLNDAAGYNSNINITTSNNVTLYTAASGVTVKGVAFAPVNPSITPSPTSLTGFTYLYGSGPSSSQSFTITGANLSGTSGTITVTGSTDYEVSSNNVTFGSTATCSYTTPVLSSTTFYVRLKAGLSVNNYNSESITISGGGVSPSATVTVSGSVAACSSYPTTQASGFSSNSVTSSGMNIAFTRGNGTGGVLVVASSGSAPSTNPTSGTTYTASATYGSGTALGNGYVVYNGTAAGTGSATGNIAISGLSAATNYYYNVYEYNTTGTCYNITALSAGPIATACVTPVNITGNGTSVTSTTSAISWTNSSCFDDVLIVVSANTISGGTPSGTGSSYTESLTYGAGSSLLNGYTVYQGTTSPQTVTGLSPATTYNYAIYTRKGTSWSSGVSGSFTTNCASPTTQASGFSNNGVTSSSMNIAFTRGNGTGGVLVVASSGSAPNTSPTSGTTYTASATYGSGTALGNGYVVYNGTSAGTGNATGNIAISGLSAGTNYYFNVYEYNSAGVCYNTTALAAGPYATLGQSYTWNTTSGNWSSSGSWTPARTSPATTDVLVFDGSVQATPSVTLDITQTVGQIIFQNASNASISQTSAYTLTVNGGSGTDFTVCNTCSLTVNTSKVLTLKIVTGATGEVDGYMLFDGNGSSTAHLFESVDTSSVQVYGTISTGSNFSGNLFGAGTGSSGVNSVVFKSGSTYIQGGGSNPFGATAPSSVVVFKTGSNFKFTQGGSANPTIAQRTYANFEYSSSSSAVAFSNNTNSGTISGNFLVSSGTCQSSGNAGFSIGGNITVNNGATFSISSTSPITLNGTSTQTITNSGTLTFASGTTLIVNNSGAGVALGSNVTLGGLTLTQGNFSVGAYTLGLNGTSISGTGAATNLITTSSSSLSFGGSASSVLIPASVSALNNLTINNTNGVGMNGSIALSDSLKILSGILTVGSGETLTLGQVNTVTGGLTVSGTLIAQTNAISGTGSFTLNSGATFKTANTSGLSGSIATSGTNTLNAGANYEFNGTAAQNTGFSSFTVGNPANITISNTSASGVTQNGSNYDMTLSGILTVNSGSVLVIPNQNNINKSGSGTVVINGTVMVQDANGFSGGSNTAFQGYSSSDFTFGSSGTVNYNGTAQVITNQLSYQYLTLSGSGTKTAPSGTLTVGGDLVNNTSGVTYAHNNGTLVMSGGTQNFNVTGNPTTFYNLTLSGTGTVTLTDTATIASAGTVTISGSASLTISQKSLTFVSDSASTARLATISSSAGTPITGSISMQRYIPAKRTFKFLSSAVQGATFAQWQKSTQITGSGGATNGFDATQTNNPSCYYYVESDTGASFYGFTSISNTGNTITSGLGYRMLVRGDRTINLSASPTPAATVTTLHVTGTPTSGAFSFPVSYTVTPPSGEPTQDGWNLVGNPYASQIDWKASSGWTKSGINDAIYIWDPSQSTSGAYFSCVGGVGSDTRTNPSYIASSQGFFVQTNAASPVLNATESVKVSGTYTANFRQETTNNLLRIKMFNANNKLDYAAIRFTDSAQVAFNKNLDAYKWGNPDMNVYAAIGGGNYSIKSLPSSFAGEIPLTITSSDTGLHTLNFFNLSSFTDTNSLTLTDLYVGKTVPVIDQMDYSFDINSNPISQGTGRFYLNKTTTVVTSDRNISHSGFSARLYPNPSSSGQVPFLVLGNGPLQSPVNIFVTDLNGRFIFNKYASPSPQNVISLPETMGLGAGVYLVKIVTGGETVVLRLHHQN